MNTNITVSIRIECEFLRDKQFASKPGLYYKGYKLGTLYEYNYEEIIDRAFTKLKRYEELASIETIRKVEEEAK